jgi:hypothetical protein
MLVAEVADDDEGGGDSAPGSTYLRVVSVLGRGPCAAVAVGTGGGGQTGGTRRRLAGLGCSGSIPASPRLGGRSGRPPPLWVAGGCCGMWLRGSACLSQLPRGI